MIKFLQRLFKDQYKVPSQTFAEIRGQVQRDLHNPYTYKDVERKRREVLND